MEAINYIYNEVGEKTAFLINLEPLQNFSIEEMEARSKYHRYMDGELVVAIELSVAKNMAAGTLKNISWSKYSNNR